MGVIQLEKRYTDVEPYYYEPWWERTSEATRIGIYVAIVVLIALSLGCIAWWIMLNRRRSAPYHPQPAYTGTRPNVHVSPWNERGYSTLNGSKESLDAYNVPKPPPRAYSYAEPDSPDGIQKDEIRAVLYKYDKN